MNLLSQVCCDGNIYFKSNGYECCGDQYIRSTMNSSDVCCAGKFYSKIRNYQCCGNRYVQVLPNPLMLLNVVLILNFSRYCGEKYVVRTKVRIGYLLGLETHVVVWCHIFLMEFRYVVMASYMTDSTKNVVVTRYSSIIRSSAFINF